MSLLRQEQKDGRFHLFQKMYSAQIRHERKKWRKRVSVEGDRAVTFCLIFPIVVCVYV